MSNFFRIPFRNIHEGEKSFFAKLTSILFFGEQVNTWVFSLELSVLFYIAHAYLLKTVLYNIKQGCQ